MITFDDIKENIKKYKQSVKNERLKDYYTPLKDEYTFDNSIDFTDFVEHLKNNDSRKICNKKLREYKEIGTHIKVEKNDNWTENEYWDDYLGDDYYKAVSKNEDLIGQLQYLRTNALGIGTNKIKRRLNKLAKESSLAKALRLAIEIEDVNILAKKSYGTYKDKNYNKKSELIFELVDLFDKNNWVYGIHKNKGRETNAIIFFEIPNTEQISFHIYLHSRNIQTYSKKWDGKENSTYPKLIDSVNSNFSEIIY